MKNIIKFSNPQTPAPGEKPRFKYRFFLSRRPASLGGGSAALAALSALVAALLPGAAVGASVFLDSSAAGNQATVNTPYGSSIYLAQPGVNTRGDFKVEDMRANWSKDNISGFNPSADAPPRALHELPVVTLGGVPYIGIGVDFNESGTAADFDVVNLMLWVGSASAPSTQVALLTDPDISSPSYAWSAAVSNQTKNEWQSKLRQMNPNPADAALGIDLVYQQNVSPAINAPGDDNPYGSDPQRLFSTGLATLGSNRADLAILVPYSVLGGYNSSQKIYLGLQTGSLADAGSDRVGFLDPDALIKGGYFDSTGISIITNYVPPDSTILVPEVSTSALLMVAGGMGLLHRRRAGPQLRLPGTREAAAAAGAPLAQR